MSNISNYRRKPQPSDEERSRLKEKAFGLFGYGFQSKLGRIFKTSSSNVHEAFKGNNPSLMNKLSNYITATAAKRAA